MSESLEPLSAGAKVLTAAMRMTLAGVHKIQLPRRIGAGAPVASWVGQGAPIPTIAFSLQAATLGPARKLCAIACCTRELAEQANGEAVISVLLREAAAKALDLKLFSAVRAESTAELQHQVKLLNAELSTLKAMTRVEPRLSRSISPNPLSRRELN